MTTDKHGDRQRTGARVRGDDGQAAVEFAIVIPLVVVMALGLVVIAVVVRNQLAIELAAREGARAAAVSGDPRSAAAAAASRAVTFPIEVTTQVGATTVTVEVSARAEVGVAIVGDLIGPVDHHASVTMMLEPPGPGGR